MNLDEYIYLIYGATLIFPVIALTIFLKANGYRIKDYLSNISSKESI